MFLFNLSCSTVFVQFSLWWVVFAVLHVNIQQQTNLFTYSTNQHTTHKTNMFHTVWPHQTKPKRTNQCNHRSTVQTRKKNNQKFTAITVAAALTCSKTRRQAPGISPLILALGQRLQLRLRLQLVLHCCVHDYGRRELFVAADAATRKRWRLEHMYSQQQCRAPRRGFRRVVATAPLATTPPPQLTSLRWRHYDIGAFISSSWPCDSFHCTLPFHLTLRCCSFIFTDILI